MVSQPAAPSGKSITIAYPKPTRASSELPGKTANLANDKDSVTAWQPAATEVVNWWQVDLENLYTVSGVRLLLASAGGGPYKIELSKDGQNWEPIAQSAGGTAESKKRIVATDSNIVGRFLRVSFTNTAGKPPAIREVEVFGKTVH